MVLGYVRERRKATFIADAATGYVHIHMRAIIGEGWHAQQNDLFKADIAPRYGLFCSLCNGSAEACHDSMFQPLLRPASLSQQSVPKRDRAVSQQEDETSHDDCQVIISWESGFKCCILHRNRWASQIFVDQLQYSVVGHIGLAMYKMPVDIEMSF